jgi:hypothetical protein
MKLPQFRVRTLLLLTAIMGVVLVACAKWPVTESIFALGGRHVGPGPYSPSITILRPPTFGEWAIRASIASAILLAVLVLIGAWRERNARSTAN